MRALISDWHIFLTGSGAPLGILLTVAGFAFLLTGWRLGRSAMVASFVIIGMVIGAIFVAAQVPTFVAVIAGGVVCGLVGAWLRDYAAAVLTGFIGSMTLWAVLGDSTIPVPTIYIVLALAFPVFGAPAFTNRRGAVIIVTSFIGALLIASGLIALAVSSRSFAPHYRSMAEYPIFYPFLLMVPLVSGIFLQQGSARRQDTGDIKL